MIWDEGKVKIFLHFRVIPSKISSSFKSIISRRKIICFNPNFYKNKKRILDPLLKTHFSLNYRFTLWYFLVIFSSPPSASFYTCAWHIFKILNWWVYKCMSVCFTVFKSKISSKFNSIISNRKFPTHSNRNFSLQSNRKFPVNLIR